MARYGKYRAIVTDVNDPKNFGRVRVKCPEVFGDYESGWALPCYPLVYVEDVTTPKGNKKICRKPKKGEGVWIEFEQGDVSKPIWVGSWRCD